MKPVRATDSEINNDLLDEMLAAARRRLDRELKLMRRHEAAVGIAGSPLGDLLVAVTERGIALNHYISDAADIAAAIARLRRCFDLVEDRRSANAVSADVSRYLAGDTAALSYKVDLTLAASAFHQRVLSALMAVPRGAVLSYQALGAAAGSANSARAIGNAMHNNPVPVYVPCHRVIASGGAIGGYGGGIARKLRLLRAEGFAIDDAARQLGGDAVWANRKTRVYCRRGCPASARADGALIMLFANSALARAAGMRPCRSCHPG